MADARERIGFAKDPPPYAGYVLGILLLLYILSLADRQILSLLVTPIKQTFGSSDTQMGALHGAAFALFYAVFGLPAGWLADHFDRSRVMAAGILLWSFMTILCGFADSYGHLFTARIGVAIGEAMLSPCAYSLLTQYYPRDRLSWATSVYGLGNTLGPGLAFVFGGAIIAALPDGGVRLPLLGSFLPWQAAFIFAGLPGLVLWLTALTIRDRRLLGAGQRVHAASDRIALTTYLLKHPRFFSSHLVSFALLAGVNFSALAWIPSLLQRQFDLSTASSGIAYGVIILVAGSFGLIGGGVLADRWFRAGGADAHLRVGALCAAVLLASGFALLFTTTLPMSLCAVAGITLGGFGWMGAAPAALQLATPPTLRGRASALYLFALVLFGLALGPIAVPLAAGLLRSESLGPPIAMFVILSSVVAALLLRSGWKHCATAQASAATFTPEAVG